MIDDNVKSREQAAQQARAIIERGVEEYLSQLRALNAVATLRAFREKADVIRQAELEKAVRSLERGVPADKALEALSRGITNKLIHAPSVQMKRASAEGRDDLVRLTQELFELTNVQPDDAPANAGDKPAGNS